MTWDELVEEITTRYPDVGLFDPGMGRVMKEWVLVPSAQSDRWLELVDKAI